MSPVALGTTQNEKVGVGVSGEPGPTAGLWCLPAASHYRALLQNVAP